MIYAREKGACSGSQTKGNIIRAPRISSNPFSDFQYCALACSILTGLFFTSAKHKMLGCVVPLQPFQYGKFLVATTHPKTSLGNYFESERILMSQLRHVRSCKICPAEPHLLLQVTLRLERRPVIVRRCCLPCSAEADFQQNPSWFKQYEDEACTILGWAAKIRPRIAVSSI